MLGQKLPSRIPRLNHAERMQNMASVVFWGITKNAGYIFPRIIRLLEPTSGPPELSGDEPQCNFVCRGTVIVWRVGFTIFRVTAAVETPEKSCCPNSAITKKCSAKISHGYFFMGLSALSTSNEIVATSKTCALGLRFSVEREPCLLATLIPSQ